MHMRIRTALLLLLCAPMTFAGTVIETSGGDRGLGRMMISEGHVRMESGGPVTLYDAGADRVTFINPARRQYQRMDRADVEKIGRQMQQMREQMEQQLQNMPEAQREQMRQQMESMMPGAGKAPEIGLEATGESGRVAGASCRQVEVMRDGRPSHRVCIADPADLGVPSADVEALMSMFGFFDEMTGSIGRATGGDIGLPAMQRMMDEYGGIPASMQRLDGGDAWRIESVESRSIDAAQFEVPAGYEEQSAFGGMQ